MARTISEIYDSSILEKQSMTELHALQPEIDNTQTLLTDLKNPSKVANWRLLFWVVAVAIWTVEKLFDAFRIEVDGKAKTLIYGTYAWYQQKALDYQHGDNLILINGTFQYAEINETKKIIKKAAAIGDGQVILKVAKLDGTELVPLDNGSENTNEMNAFAAYIKKIKPAGTKVSIISTVADMVNFTYTVYYDPIVMASDGSLLSDSNVFPVIDAINNYIGNLDFPGTLILTKLTDSIQLASGVIDPIITTAKHKVDDTYIDFTNGKYSAESGYFKLDEATKLTGITYISNV